MRSTPPPPPRSPGSAPSRELPGWQLLPWQNLAASVVPATLLLVALGADPTLIEGAPSATDAQAVPAQQLLERIEVEGAPEGLLVVLTRQGTHVAWTDPRGPAQALAPSHHRTGLAERAHFLPCVDRSGRTTTCRTPGDWDHRALVQTLRELKASHPQADTLTLAPAEDVPFRAVTDALSSARFDGKEPLFPYAVISRR